MSVEANCDELAQVGLRLLDLTVAVSSSQPDFVSALARYFDPQAMLPAHNPVDLRVVASDVIPNRQLKFHAKIDAEPAESWQRIGLSGRCSPSMLAASLNRWAIGSTRRHHIFHAAAVGTGESGILLPGHTRTGKTTLAAALAQRGFELFSDEIGAIDTQTGQLVAYPRALLVRKDILPLIGLAASEEMEAEQGKQQIVPAAALGGRREMGAQPAVIIAPRYTAGARTQMVPLRSGAAVMILAETSCSLGIFKESGFDFLIDLARRVPCYRLIFSQLDEAISAIEETIAQVQTQAVRGLS